ncbi:C2H2-type domain-containing protein [Mycena chlorophos]|uniref:C2H2-type domain-containing protein n=1 Tax=Mycena chlorophos TaxID=658473 RepID=A0A8H6S405_MYCCL|nr:C2H2-type domain-containing protein [Mycena chlorophos]
MSRHKSFGDSKPYNSSSTPDPHYLLRPVSPPPPEGSKTPTHQGSARPSPTSDAFPRPTLPSFSTYRAPSASYMWPSFQTSSQMERSPRLYAIHSRVAPTSSDSSDSSDDEHGHSMTRLRASTRRLEPLSISSLNRLLNPLESSTTHTNGFPSNTTCDVPFPSRQDRRRGLPSPVDSPPAASPPPFLTEAVSPLLYLPSSRPASSASVAATVSSSSGPVVNPAELVGEQVISGSSASGWEAYARKVDERDPHSPFRCIYPESREGPGPCQYASKKQLVKRHIETVHLRLKPFECNICRKCFPQKTSLDIHHNGHTGKKPHKCVYEGCDQEFKDPARRHRHYREKHGYEPQHGKNARR